MLSHGRRHEQGVALPTTVNAPIVRSEALLGPPLPGAPGRWPGLLLEWRQTVDGDWEGRVAYVAHLQNGHALVELWLPAELLHATPLDVRRGSESKARRCSLEHPSTSSAVSATSGCRRWRLTVYFPCTHRC